ncbi:hypothetical protein HMPREF0208_05109 [Citrobacter koseri]|nr:hypothetical protein HMPREF0208_05109 [Citrobacter koseri]
MISLPDGADAYRAYIQERSNTHRRPDKTPCVAIRQYIRY